MNRVKNFTTLGLTLISITLLVSVGCLHVRTKIQQTGRVATTTQPAALRGGIVVQSAANHPQTSPATVNKPQTPSTVKTVDFQQVDDLDENAGVQTDEKSADNGIDSGFEKPFDATSAAPRLPLETERIASNSIRDSAAPAYTLADIEQLALNNNSVISAAHANVRKAAGLRQQVTTGPNPTMGAFGQQLFDKNTDQVGLLIEKEFVRGNKLALNQAVLNQTIKAQQWELETQRYRVLTDVRLRFFEAATAQAERNAIRDFEKVASKGVSVASDLLKAEEGTKIEVLQAQTLLSEVSLAAEQAEANFRGAWQDLAAVAGVPEMAPGELTVDLENSAVEKNWPTVSDTIVSESPELRVANALVCEKLAYLNRQQVQAIPNVNGQMGVGYDFGTQSEMLNLQVSAPIPIKNLNAGNIAAAKADYHQALDNVRRIEMAIKSRLARTSQEFDSAYAAVQRYQLEIIPQAKQSLDLSEQAYRAGELAFLQVLIVRRAYYESTIQYIRSQGLLAQAEAKVAGLLLTSGLDAPQDYTDGDGLRGISFDGR